jgi:hypothetical protein
LPIEAHGHVRLESPGGRSLNVVADGSTLHLELSGRSDLRSLMPRSLSASRRAVRHANRVLTALGLMVSLESGGRPVFQLGADVRPSLLARLIGLAPARIPFSAIRLLFSS